MLRRNNISCLLLRPLLVAILAMTLAAQAQAIEVLTAAGESFTQWTAVNKRYYHNEFGLLQHEEFQKQVPYFDDVEYSRTKQRTDELEEKARLMEDILRIQRIVQSPPTFLNLLQFLNRAAVALIAKDGLEAQVAFERALSEMEEANFFPTERVIALSALDGVEFLQTVADGQVLNDIGPGVRHGEYSHRLQWAAIMADYEANRAAWNSPPYELYTKIGEADLDIKANKAGRYGIWLTLFDMPGQALNRASDRSLRYSAQPTSGMKFVPDGFRHPDRLGSLFGIPDGLMSEGRANVAGATPAEIAKNRVFNTRIDAGTQGAEMDKLALVESVVRARYNQRLLGAFDAFRASGEPEYVVSTDVMPVDVHFDAYVKSLVTDMKASGNFTTILRSKDPARPKLVLMQDDFYKNLLNARYPEETKAIRRLAARAARAGGDDDDDGVGRNDDDAAGRLKTELDALDKKIAEDTKANPNLLSGLRQAFTDFKGQANGKPRRAGQPPFAPVLAFPDGEFDNLSRQMIIHVQEDMKPDINPVTGTKLDPKEGESASTAKTKTKVRNKKH